MRPTTRLFHSMLALIATLSLALGLSMPAQAAGSSYPQPKPPGCTFTWFGTHADCSLSDTYAGLVRLSTPYLASKNAQFRQGAIPAMIWTTLGAAAVSSKNGRVNSINSVNRNYLITAIANLNNYNPSNGQISCVRNVLLTYVVKAGQKDKLVDNAYQYWQTAKDIDDVLTIFGVLKDDAGVGDYLELVVKSRGTVTYIGKTADARNTVEALVANCALS